jgi:uncharacterized membrane protein
MVRFVSKTLLRGLTVVLPVIAAVYVIAWLIGDTETALRKLLSYVLPERFYLPGMGWAVLLIGVFLVGILMYPWLSRKFLNGMDTLFRKIPLFSTIYSPLRDLMEIFGGDMSKKFGQVVLIKLPNTDVETLGFVTREDLSDLPEGFSKSDHVVVYVQWSSQVGGYCFVVPRDSVTPLNITVEQGMRWALTAGLSAPKNAAGSSRQAAATD